MRILVTGATGRVGSRLTPRLVEEYENVRVLVRNAEQAAHWRSRGTEAIVGDLGEPDSLAQAVDGIDTIVHLAAFFRGATEAQARAVNVNGTRTLVEAARAAAVSQFIHASTNMVYGHGFDHPAREDDPLPPAADNYYAQTKCETEQALLARARSNNEMKICILRLAFVYGEGDPHLAEAVRWVRAWHPDKKFHLVHHADVAQAVQRVIAASGIHGKIYNVADDQPLTAAELLALNGLTVSEEAKQASLGNPWDTVVDTTRIHLELGFAPIYPSVFAAQFAGVL